MQPKPGQMWRYRNSGNPSGFDRMVLVIDRKSYPRGCPDQHEFSCKCVTFWTYGETTVEMWYWPDDNWELICDA